MKKLKLDLGDLKVDSFETVSKLAEKKGTVAGNAWTNHAPTCDEFTCPGRITCAYGDTCGPSECPGTTW